MSNPTPVRPTISRFVFWAAVTISTLAAAGFIIAFALGVYFPFLSELVRPVYDFGNSAFLEDISPWPQLCAKSASPLTQYAISELTDISRQVNFNISVFTAERSSATRLYNWYSAVVIILGMATTIFASLNSSEYSTSGEWAGRIKFYAILFPASVTAVTALGAVFAPGDQISKNGQAIYGLMALKASINAEFVKVSCPVDDTGVKQLVADAADFSKRLAEIVSGGGTSTKGSDANSQPNNQTPAPSKT